MSCANFSENRHSAGRGRPAPAPCFRAGKQPPIRRKPFGRSVRPSAWRTLGFAGWPRLTSWRNLWRCYQSRDPPRKQGISFADRILGWHDAARQKSAVLSRQNPSPSPARPAVLWACRAFTAALLVAGVWTLWPRGRPFLLGGHADGWHGALWLLAAGSTLAALARHLPL